MDIGTIFDQIKMCNFFFVYNFQILVQVYFCCWQKISLIFYKNIPLVLTFTDISRCQHHANSERSRSVTLLNFADRCNSSFCARLIAKNNLCVVTTDFGKVRQPTFVDLDTHRVQDIMLLDIGRGAQHGCRLSCWHVLRVGGRHGEFGFVGFHSVPVMSQVVCLSCLFFLCILFKILCIKQFKHWGLSRYSHTLNSINSHFVILEPSRKKI